ncbi:MAPEG family protein, partial [Streptomyces caeruleatus]
MILPTTLTADGLAALINIWLAVRCGQTRGKEKVLIGDGGNEAMIRRMRAHSNFSEFTPIVLILIGVIEYA